jgi:DNA-binding HxlR family transcriptional regulator
MVLDPADVLALLEVGASSTTELARIFQLPAAALTAAMNALVAEGLVKRHSTSGHWCRVVRSAASIADLEAVFDQLRFLPKTPTQIAEALGSSDKDVSRALEQLLDLRRVKVIGRNSGARWAPIDWTSGRPQRAFNRTLRPKKAETAPGVPNNQHAHLFPPKAAKAATAAPVAGASSWWLPGAGVEAPRAEFYRLQAARDKAGQTDPAWRRRDKVVEISSGRVDV